MPISGARHATGRARRGVARAFLAIAVALAAAPAVTNANGNASSIESSARRAELRISRGDLARRIRARVQRIATRVLASEPVSLESFINTRGLRACSEMRNRLGDRQGSTWGVRFITTPVEVRSTPRKRKPVLLLFVHSRKPPYLLSREARLLDGAGTPAEAAGIFSGLSERVSHGMTLAVLDYDPREGTERSVELLTEALAALSPGFHVIVMGFSSSNLIIKKAILDDERGLFENVHYLAVSDTPGIWMMRGISRLRVFPQTWEDADPEGDLQSELDRAYGLHAYDEKTASRTVIAVEGDSWRPDIEEMNARSLAGAVLLPPRTTDGRHVEPMVRSETVEIVEAMLREISGPAPAVRALPVAGRPGAPDSSLVAPSPHSR